MQKEIIHYKEDCMNCGACAGIAQKFFKSGKNGEVQLINKEITNNNELKIINECINNCPSDAIEIR